MRSTKQAQAQEAALRARLAQAETQIFHLTVRRRGKKCFTTFADLQTATNNILTKYQVEGLLEVHLSEIRVKRQIRSYLSRPARTETESQFTVEALVNETVLNQAIRRLGWRVYATNAKYESLSLISAVLA